VARQRPELATTVGALARAYVEARYLGQRPREATFELAAAVKALTA
jgi:hypothetical protein